LQAAEAGLLKSAHDCSDGGLAVALAESCFSSPGRQAIGASLVLAKSFATNSLLFSESPSRIVITFDPADEATVRGIAETNDAPFLILGTVGGKDLRIKVDQEEVVAASVSQLESEWRGGLTNKLHPDALIVS